VPELDIDDFDDDDISELLADDEPESPELEPPPSGEDDPADFIEAVRGDPPPAPTAITSDPGGDDIPEEFMTDLGLRQESRSGVDPIIKPWMKFHEFRLIQDISEVVELVDHVIDHGACALDLETDGFDNRIDYIDGQPKTRHQIVGYCIGCQGKGYYLPLRHKYDPEMGEQNPNLPVAATNAEIKRLCLASQPILTKEGMERDPYGSPLIETPPKVVIYFWHSLFDQEFLFPVTGIDFWHPESFEDGMIAAYVVFSDDKNLKLKTKAKQRLSVKDPETGEIYPYEMIEFNDLFMRRTPKHEKKFANLHPNLDHNAVMYGCSDGICTELLCEVAKDIKWAHAQAGLKFKYNETVSPAMTNRFRGTYRLEKQTVMAVRVMERSRTKVDKKVIDELLEEAYLEKEKILAAILKIAEAAGFKNLNPGSTEQLSEFLFTKKGLDISPKPDKLEKSGQFKTDAKTLESFVEKDPNAPEVLVLVVQYRQVDKIIGTYLKSLAANTDERDQLRFSFRQTGAATGRFTAPKGDADHGFAGVPIHGIPARFDPKRPKVANSLRRLFVAHDGYTMAKIDYAGQELRVVANLSGEPLWIHEFETGSGDLHTLTAQAFFGAHITKADKLERTAGKIANFSLIYGGGVQAIQRATGCDKVEAARKLAAFHKSVPTFSRWVDNQHNLVKKHLGVVTGFRRFVAIPDANVRVGDVDSRGKLVEDGKKVRMIRAGCERKSTNYPIQGSGADILKISFVLLVKELHRRGWLKNGGDDSVRMLMTVHDEIVFEIRDDRVQEAVPIISEIMESPSTLAKWRIPLIVEPLLGKSWDAKYDWLEMKAGKQEIPPWLEGKLDMGAPPPPPVRDTSPAPKAVEPGSPPPATPEAAPATLAPPKAPEPADTTKKKVEMVTFALPSNYLTRQSIRLVLKVLAGAVPIGPEVGQPRFKKLRVVAPGGSVLVRPALGIFVDPERFQQGLRDCNLGPGVFDVGAENQ